MEPSIFWYCWKWKSLVPEKCWCLPVVGHLAYWGFRIGYPWNTRVIPWLSARVGREFPCLRNHFFVLRPSSPTPADGSADATPRHIDQGREVEEGTH